MSNNQTAAEVPVDERVCLALYQASRAMTARYRPILSRLGLTYPQYLVMSVLWEDGPTSLHRVGDRLALDSNTLSPLIKRLEAMDLLRRARDPLDERAVRISLTPRGSRLRARADTVPDQICRAMGLSTAAQSKLVGTLRELIDQLESSVD